MKRTSLEYYKFILERVSFDSNLFEKEYKKAVTHLEQEEAIELKNWVKQKFTQHTSILS